MSEAMKQMYVVMIKVDKTLPWIELNEAYATKKGAKEAAERSLKAMKAKVINLSEKQQPIKALISVRSSR
jgi:hypothetical protein